MTKTLDAYFARDLVLASAPVDYPAGEAITSIHDHRLFFRLPIALQKGDQILISLPDGKVWAARRGGVVFWICTEEPFTIALILPQTLDSFQRLWDGLDGLIDTNKAEK